MTSPRTGTGGPSLGQDGHLRCQAVHGSDRSQQRDIQPQERQAAFLQPDALRRRLLSVGERHAVGQADRGGSGADRRRAGPRRGARRAADGATEQGQRATWMLVGRIGRGRPDRESEGGPPSFSSTLGTLPVRGGETMPARSAPFTRGENCKPAELVRFHGLLTDARRQMSYTIRPSCVEPTGPPLAAGQDGIVWERVRHPLGYDQIMQQAASDRLPVEVAALAQPKWIAGALASKSTCRHRSSRITPWR
jgi:hypothetical protein